MFAIRASDGERLWTTKATGHAGESPAMPNSAGDAGRGKQVFASNCSGCHGLTGHGGNGGPDLSTRPTAKNVTRVLDQVRNGGGGMPPFKGSLSQQQIADVAAYVTQKVAGGG